MSDKGVNPPRRPVSLAGAVGANWLGYLVFAVSGFLLPRLIGDSIGQERLGIWDFAWASVGFTQWLTLGVASVISRDVARFRASDNWAALSQSVSATLAVLSLAFGGGLVLIGAFVFLTPSLLPPETDSAVIFEARCVVAILGVNAAAALPLGLFRGILSGLERWDLKNLTRSGPHLVAVAIIVLLLLAGHGLVALAWAMLASDVAGHLWSYRFVKRLCPELKISPRLITRHDLREVLSFGGRTYLQGIARGTLYQVNGLIVAAWMGPAALAVYARQRNLVIFAQRLTNQYGNVFTPASAALAARGDQVKLRELALKSARYGMCLALPMVVVLAIAGGPLVRLWMGHAYEAPLVLAVLAIGHLLSFAHRGSYRILVGIGRHGWAGMAEFCSAVLATGAAYLLVGPLHGGLLGASVAVAVAVTVGGGLMPAVLLCRALQIRLASFLWKTTWAPLLGVLPLAAALIVGQVLFADQPMISLAVGLGVGGASLAAVYWRWILPPSFKKRLLKRFRRAGRAEARSIGGAADGSEART